METATAGKDSYRAYNASEAAAARGQKAMVRQEGNWMTGGGPSERQTVANLTYRAYSNEEAQAARQARQRPRSSDGAPFGRNSDKMELHSSYKGSCTYYVIMWVQWGHNDVKSLCIPP